MDEKLSLEEKIKNKIIIDAKFWKGKPYLQIKIIQPSSSKKQRKQKV